MGAMKQLFQETLTVLDEAFSALEKAVPKPQRVDHGPGFTFRYEERSIYQAIVLKMARQISGLRAALLLLEHGYVQEQAALQRILFELDEDIFFLVMGITNDTITALHKRYLDAFFEEEFEDPNNPIASPQNREMIPRKKIRAYLARIADERNPSDQVELFKTLDKAYSGYVHAAAPHIMDMYGGNPRRFHLSGMLGTPRINEHADDLWNYFYRALLSITGAAKAFGDAQLVADLYKNIESFEKRSGQSPF